MRRRLLVFVVALATLFGLPAAAAAHGAVHLDGSGLRFTGSNRVNSANADLPCLGVQAGTGDIAEVVVSTDSTSHLVADAAGHAHIRVMVRDFTYGVYRAPGTDLPNPGDPGFLFLGSTTRAIVFELDQLTPTQPGEVEVRLSIPMRMHNENGTATVDAFYDFLFVVLLDSNGAPQSLGIAPIGGRCP